MYEVVDAMLADIAFRAPVEIEDCMAVRDALKLALPAASVEVHFYTGKSGDHVIIRVDGITRMVQVQ